MDRASELLRRSRILATIALAGAVVLLALLIAVPIVVPHEILPAPILVFWGVFILIAALILGISSAYVFLTRAQVVPGASEPAPRAPSTELLREPGRVGDVEGLAIRLLDGDERRLFRAIVQAQGSILQQDLVRVTEFSDAKVSRLLDRLEERGLVVRERHGMTNRIRLTIREGQSAAPFARFRNGLQRRGEGSKGLFSDH
ncbi:MAG: helix-turn-helix transcriptional regulator [Methanobacteriota archaeon]